VACTAQAGRNRDTDSRPALKCSQNLDGRLSSRAQFLSLVLIGSNPRPLACGPWHDVCAFIPSPSESQPL